MKWKCYENPATGAKRKAPPGDFPVGLFSKQEGFRRSNDAISSAQLHHISAAKTCQRLTIDSPRKLPIDNRRKSGITESQRLGGDKLAVGQPRPPLWHNVPPGAFITNDFEVQTKWELQALRACASLKH